MSKCQQAAILTSVTHNIMQYSGHAVTAAAVFYLQICFACATLKDCRIFSNGQSVHFQDFLILMC